ncbi:MAG: hypothetical protein QME81_09745 [bacterium]|nr:hypothetical protein [bacterium]
MRVANLSPDGKIKLPNVTKIAERVPDPEGEMSLEEISHEIHRYREEKRKKEVSYGPGNNSS